MGWTGPLAALTDLSGPLDWAAGARLLLAAVFGGIVGWERERHGRAAGFRTHLLLCVGCALVMLVSLYVPTRFAGQTSDSIVRADPGRMAGHVLSGLGFLGAGAIIVLGSRIRGLTTAAYIWVTAAIGLAVGCGYLVPATVTFLIVMVALHGLVRWERAMEEKDRYVRLRLNFSRPGERMHEIRSLLAAHSLETLSYVVNRDEETALYELQLRHARPVDFERVTNELADGLTGEGIKKIEWS